MADSEQDTAWTWTRLLQHAPAHIVRRAAEHLDAERVQLHAGGAHPAGMVAGYHAGADARTGDGHCACGVDAPCAHLIALLAAASRLKAAKAPPEVLTANRPAFGPGDPPTPVPAFPETANDLEVPADALSEAQRAALEATPGAVRKSATVYTLPREAADVFGGLLEAEGTGLVVYKRRPFVRFRASLPKADPRAVHLVATEMPGMGVRSLLEAHGFRPLRKPKSLVHEYEGPVDELHALAESFGEQGTAVILASGAPPTFEPLAAAPPERARTRAPLMPVLFSRRRFEWWTPRDGLAPLQFALVSRHGRPAEKGFLLTSEGLRSAERELLAAGLHAHRVEDPNPTEATVESGPAEGESAVRLRIGEGAAYRVLQSNGFGPRDATGPQMVLVGPTANLPIVAAGLAQAGVHLLPPHGGWPALPEPPTSAPLFADDPRLPVAKEGRLVPQKERVGLATEPAGGVLPRALRVELYRLGWFTQANQVEAPIEDAGRLVAALREGGFESKWPKPTKNDWRLSSVRYSERSRKDGGGTIVHLKGPIPIGRLGGVDPGEEAERIAAIVHEMEAALKRHHPDARPLAHGAMPGVWVVNRGAGAFLLEAADRGASVTPMPAFSPIPVGRGVVLVDTTCLPPRLTEYRRASSADDASRPVTSPEIENVIRRVVPEGVEIDADRGHYLVPSTRMGALVSALREMGAKVLNRRLAPKGKRYQRWEPKLPEDETGQRPKLREPWRGTYDGDVPNLRPECVLDPHQREGLAFILHHEHKCLLADEMGLGKTLQAITAAQFLPGRVLVVCPASARDVWKTEVHGWTTEKARVLMPKDRADDWMREKHEEKYVVVAYSGLQKFADAIGAQRFDLVILDESHYVKSRAAQRTRLVHDRLSHIPRRLILSGTPVMNEPKEIRTQLAFVHPDEWSDTAWFNRRFQEPWKHGTDEVREKVLSRLREYLEGIMLRREKRVALPDLPEKNLHVVRLQLPKDARDAYDEQEDEFRDYVQDHEETALSQGMATTAGRLERLKQTALVGKLPQIVEAVRALVAGGDKVVLFCHYREPIRALGKELQDLGTVTLTGSTAPDERTRAVKRFQKEERIRVFIGQTQAAGVAVTLTAARHAVFCDLEWNPATHRQAMDRIHRKTQTRDVDIHFYLADDTIEETIAEVLEEKTEMMDQLLEGRKGSTLGLRDKQAAQREVALRLLSRKRRRKSALDAEEDEDDD